MVWTVPVTFVANDVLTAAQLNTFLRDNMLETAPGKASLPNRLMCATGINSIEERQWARDFNDSTSTLTIEAQFPTVEEVEEDGDDKTLSVTVHHGGRVLVFFDAGIRVSAGNGNAMASIAIDGSMPENSNRAIRTARTRWSRIGTSAIYTLEPGISKFEMVYGTSNTSTVAQYRHRRMVALPV